MSQVGGYVTPDRGGDWIKAASELLRAGDVEGAHVFATVAVAVQLERVNQHQAEVIERLVEVQERLELLRELG